MHNAENNMLPSDPILSLRSSTVLVGLEYLAFILCARQSLQLLGQGNALGPSALDIDHHHEGKRQANQDGQKPERLLNSQSQVCKSRTPQGLEMVKQASIEGYSRTGRISPNASVMAPTIAGPNTLLPLSVIAYSA